MYLIAIKIKDRVENAPDIQEVLTRYGKNIEARLGLREKENVHEGNIIRVYDGEDLKDFLEELSNFDEIKINYMEM